MGVGFSALFSFIFIPRKDYWVGVCVGNELGRGEGITLDMRGGADDNAPIF